MQVKDGRITSIAVDEPARRVFWYNSDLQQLSSSSYTGSAIRTHFSRLKHLSSLLVHGDLLFWLEEGSRLRRADKRERVQARVQEANLPRASHISVVRSEDAVLEECRGCSGGLCRVVEGTGPSCVEESEPQCACLNGGNCTLSPDGRWACVCLAGYSGQSCGLLESPSSSSGGPLVPLLWVVGVLFALLAVALLVRRYSPYSFGTMKTMVAQKVLPRGGIPYQPTSLTMDSCRESPERVGIVNSALEEYDLEELASDQDGLIPSQQFEEDLI